MLVKSRPKAAEKIDNPPDSGIAGIGPLCLPFASYHCSALNSVRPSYHIHAHFWELLLLRFLLYDFASSGCL